MNTYYRILYSLIVICISAFVPWWISLVLGIIGIFLFPWFIEIIILGLFFDTAFGTGSVWYLSLLHTGIFTIPLILGEFIKTRIYV